MNLLRSRGAAATSPLRIGGEDVVLVRNYRVAGKAALGVVLLRRRAVFVAGLERLGRRVIVELGVSPSAAVREALAVLHHEVRIMQCAGHDRIARLILGLSFSPMDLR